jgi:hypothetical protein
MLFKSAIGLASCRAFLLRIKTEFRGLKGEPSGMSPDRKNVLTIRSSSEPWFQIKGIP